MNPIQPSQMREKSKVLGKKNLLLRWGLVPHPAPKSKWGGEPGCVQVREELRWEWDDIKSSKLDKCIRQSGQILSKDFWGDERRGPVQLRWKGPTSEATQRPPLRSRLIFCTIKDSQLGQMHLTISTNAFDHLDKCLWQVTRNQRLSSYSTQLLRSRAPDVE